MLTRQRCRSGAILSTAGLAAALVAASVNPANAGPFQWLTGKNQPAQQPQQQQQQQPSGNAGLFPFFGGGRGGQTWRGEPDPTTAKHADELPLNDAEVMLITNPALGTPTLSTRNIEATKAAIEKYRSIVAQGGWPMGRVRGSCSRDGRRGGRHRPQWHRGGCHRM